MQRTRQTRRPCTHAHQCTAQHTTLPCLNPSIMSFQRQQPILTTATQTPKKATITRQSKHSLVALQHVRFAQDEGLNARGMTSKRCLVQGRLAVAAHAHISEHPNTTLPCLKPQYHVPSKTTTNPNHSNSNTHNSNHHSSIKTLTCRIAARPLCPG